DETPCDSGVARGSLFETGGSGATPGPEACAASRDGEIVPIAAIARKAAVAAATARRRGGIEPGAARRETYGIERRLLGNRMWHYPPNGSQVVCPRRVRRRRVR